MPGSETLWLLGTAIVWVLLSVVNAGFSNADMQHSLDFLGSKSCEHYRRDLAFSIGWSLFFGPVAWTLTPFLTGFYEHGWRLRRRSDCGGAYD